MLAILKQILVFCIFCIFLGCTQKANNNLIPTTYFFSAPQKLSYQLSPNGLYVSYIKNHNNVSNIFLIEISKGITRQITKFKTGQIRDCFWANNQTVFYVLSNQYGEGLFYVNTDGTGNVKTIQAKKIDFISNKLWHNKFLLLAIKSKFSNQNAYQVNISNWRQKLIGLNPGNIIKWKADNLGRVRLAIESDGITENILFRETYKNYFKQIAVSNFENTIVPLSFNKTNNSFYALSNLNADKTALVLINCTSGFQTDIIQTNTDIIGVNFNNTYPCAVNLAAEKKKMICLNNKFETLYNQIKNKYRLINLEILQSDILENTFLVKNCSDRQPDAFYVFNNTTKSLKKISGNVSIPESEFCEMKPIKFISRNGLNINGYLTLPKNKKYNMGCVVLPHSQQFNNDVWGFVPEVQFLANRGYAVLQINYRGSAGYGKAFKMAGLNNGATLILNDIEDGTQWLIDKRIADPEKIAIYGFGFGGFLALNRAFNQPQMYSCAASYSGINNFFTYLKDFSHYSKPHQQMLNQAVGNPQKNAKCFRRISPIFNIDKFKNPLFIAQGAKDKFVSVNETNQFVKNLRKKNVKVRYLLNDTEGHVYTNQRNIIELYNNLDIFLKQNLN